MIETPIILPITKTINEIPTISIFGGHKGHLGIQLDNSSKGLGKEIFTNYNCDCIGCVFNFLNRKGYFEICEKRGFDLRNSISEVLKYIWENSDYAYPKCWECIDESKFPVASCGPSLDSWEDCKGKYHKTIDKFHLTDDDLKPVSLKKFDFRLENGPVCLNAKIKKISTPEVSRSNEYTQKVLLADNDTEKTIDAIFNNNCADYDKWKKNDSIKVYGYYKQFPKAELVINEAFKICNESPVNFSGNRNVKFPGYDAWKRQVLSRDNQECICCGHNKHLQVHHLFGYKENPELAINPHNGVTLCKFCHDKYHSIYGLKEINPINFIEFIKKYGVKQ